MRKIATESNQLAETQREMEDASRETRLSLRAIEKNKAAADLRRKLTVRLAGYGTKLDGITKRLVELTVKRSELVVRLTDSVRQLKYLRRSKPSKRSS